MWRLRIWWHGACVHFQSKLYPRIHSTRQTGCLVVSDDWSWRIGLVRCTTIAEWWHHVADRALDRAGHTDRWAGTRLEISNRVCLYQVCQDLMSASFVCMEVGREEWTVGQTVALFRCRHRCRIGCDARIRRPPVDWWPVWCAV